MIPTPQPRKTLWGTLAAQYSKSFGICQTPDWMQKLTRSNATRTLMTWRTFTVDWRKFTGQLHQPHVLSSLLSTDGLALIKEKEKILDRWAEQSNSVLSRPSTINDEAINRLPQFPINHSLDAVPTLEEIQKAISLLSTGKAPSGDCIPAEIYKEGGMSLVKNLHSLFDLIWNQGKVPHDLKDASIIHLCKRKGNRQTCDNHRGISLLSIAGKTLARVILTVSLNTLRMVSCPRVSAASGRIVVQSTWCSLHVSCKRSVRNRTPTCTPLTSIWQRLSTLSAERSFGESWRSKDAQQTSSPLFDSCTMGYRRESKTAANLQTQSLSRMECRKLRPRPDAFQLDVFSHVDWCLRWHGRRNRHQMALWWFSLQSQTVASEDQVSVEHHQWSLICW